jgi:hypothetical protein
MGHLNAKFFGDQISPKSRESIFSQLPVPGFFRFFFNDKQNEKAEHPTFGTATYLDYAFVLIKSTTVWKSGTETKTGGGWAMRRKSTNTMVSVKKVALVIGECT